MQQFYSLVSKRFKLGTVINDRLFKMSKPAKRQVAQLPFPMPQRDEENEETLEQVRPKPKRYADRTFMPPAGTRRSMGKR